MYIISIDPGNNGALALLHKDTKVEVITFSVVPTYTTENKSKSKNKTIHIDFIAVKNLIEEWDALTKNKIEMIVIEEQLKNRTHNKQLISSSAAAGTTMKQYGMYLGLFLGMNKSYTAIFPAEWSKIYKDVEINSDIPNTHTEPSKMKSISKCLELYPDIDLKKTARSINMHDGISDAILIGNYYLTKN